MMENKNDAEPPIITIENVDDHELNHEQSDGNSEAVTIVVEIDNTLSSAVTSLDVPEATKNGNEARNNGQASPLQRNKSVYGSSEKIHFDEETRILATTLIQDAKEGRNFQFKTEPHFVRSYILYHKFYLRWLLYFFIMINLCLALVEKPAREGWLIPYWGSMIIEVTCLSYFLFRFIHAAYFTQKSVFWKDTKNILILINILLTFIDILCYIIWINQSPSTHPVRWSRPLRPLYIINFSDGKQIRRAFRNIRRTVPEIMNVLILFLLSVLLFGLLALKLFNKRNMTYPNGNPYFSNYFDSIWDLYVLVTTANNPDVMMPAYDDSKWFALFFIAYLIICLYIFMSILLAAIFNNYKKNLKNEIRDAVYIKRRKLAQAFGNVHITKNGKQVINHSTWSHLLKSILPNKSQNHIDLLMKVLDVDGDNTISKQEFLKMADLLELQLTEVKDRMTLLEQLIPNTYNHRYSVLFRKMVRHKYFRFFFDFMIFVNAWFIGFDVAADEVDWFFLSIFMVEIAFKLYTFGPKEFLKRFWNVFDALVIGAAVIASAVEAGDGASKDELRTLDLLLVLRVMRLIKLFGSIQRFKVILMTIINIGPSIATYGGVIFVFYYIFAIIGMEIFGGLISYYGYNDDRNMTELFCGNPQLEGTIFYRSHYCNNNFNDILNSLVVLFELTVVNQWHVLTNGFVIVTSKAARLYFFLFHICCVVIVLNIFIAFILEAFILEYSLQKAGKLESTLESKIKELGLGIGQVMKGNQKNNDNVELVCNEEAPAVEYLPHVRAEPEENEESDTDSIPDFSKEEGLKFHIRKKSRKKVEVLLQQMFEGEIDPEDEGVDIDTLTDQKPRTITFDSVT